MFFKFPNPFAVGCCSVKNGNSLSTRDHHETSGVRYNVGYIGSLFPWKANGIKRNCLFKSEDVESWLEVSRQYSIIMRS
jgi:hypothetical protein